jgi:hypothetical protein
MIKLLISILVTINLYANTNDETLPKDAFVSATTTSIVGKKSSVKKVDTFEEKWIDVDKYTPLHPSNANFMWCRPLKQKWLDYNHELSMSYFTKVSRVDLSSGRVVCNVYRKDNRGTPHIMGQDSFYNKELAKDYQLGEILGDDNWMQNYSDSTSVVKNVKSKMNEVYNGYYGKSSIKYLNLSDLLVAAFTLNDTIIDLDETLNTNSLQLQSGYTMQATQYRDANTSVMDDFFIFLGVQEQEKVVKDVTVTMLTISSTVVVWIDFMLRFFNGILDSVVMLFVMFTALIVVGSFAMKKIDNIVQKDEKEAKIYWLKNSIMSASLLLTTILGSTSLVKNSDGDKIYTTVAIGAIQQLSMYSSSLANDATLITADVVTNYLSMVENIYGKKQVDNAIEKSPIVEAKLDFYTQMSATCEKRFPFMNKIYPSNDTTYFEKMANDKQKYREYLNSSQLNNYYTNTKLSPNITEKQKEWYRYHPLSYEFCRYAQDQEVSLAAIQKKYQDIIESYNEKGNEQKLKNTSAMIYRSVYELGWIAAPVVPAIAMLYKGINSDIEQIDEIKEKISKREESVKGASDGIYAVLNNSVYFVAPYFSQLQQSIGGMIKGTAGVVSDFFPAAKAFENSTNALSSIVSFLISVNLYQNFLFLTPIAIIIFLTIIRSLMISISMFVYIFTLFIVALKVLVTQQWQQFYTHLTQGMVILIKPFVLIFVVFVAYMAHQFLFQVGTLLGINYIELLKNLNEMNDSGVLQITSLQLFGSLLSLVMQFGSIIVVSIMILRLPENIIKQLGIQTQDSIGDTMSHEVGHRSQRYTDMV